MARKAPTKALKKSARRSYTSGVRAEAAQATRARILGAARKLFARHGFAATTIEMVAAEAKVSAPAIYQGFGGKAGLLSAQLDAIDDMARLSELRAVVGNAQASPREQAAALAAFMTRLLSGAGDLLSAARSSGDLELKKLVAGGAVRHRNGVLGLAKQWEARRVLRAGVTAERAAAIVTSITAHEAYQSLTGDWGWTDAAYEAWLGETIERLVLAS